MNSLAMLWNKTCEEYPILGNTSIEKNCDQELKIILEHVDRLFAEINKDTTEEIACLTKKLSESDLCVQKHSVTIEKLELQLKSYQSELLKAEEKHKQSKYSHEHEIKVLKEEIEALKETNEVLESRISDTGVKNLIQQNNVDKKITVEKFESKKSQNIQSVDNHREEIVQKILEKENKKARELLDAIDSRIAQVNCIKIF